MKGILRGRKGCRGGKEGQIETGRGWGGRGGGEGTTRKCFARSQKHHLGSPDFDETPTPNSDFEKDSEIVRGTKLGLGPSVGEYQVGQEVGTTVHTNPHPLSSDPSFIRTPVWTSLETGWTSRLRREWVTTQTPRGTKLRRYGPEHRTS